MKYRRKPTKVVKNMKKMKRRVLRKSRIKMNFIKGNEEIKIKKRN